MTYEGVIKDPEQEKMLFKPYGFQPTKNLYLSALIALAPTRRSPPDFFMLIVSGSE